MGPKEFGPETEDLHSNSPKMIKFQLLGKSIQ